jgi:hypothetical protein
LEGLGSAIDEETEVFQDDRPDQGVGSAGLDKGGEDPLPAQRFDRNVLDQGSGREATVA